MTDIIVTRGKYPQLFGGLGFHNNDATMYHVMEREHFNQVICKNYREISPGFMRTFGGFAEWTKEAMDEFAEYYEQMQKWTDTPIYLAGAKGKLHFYDEDIWEYAHPQTPECPTIPRPRQIRQSLPILKPRPKSTRYQRASGIP